MAQKHLSLEPLQQVALTPIDEPARLQIPIELDQMMIEKAPKPKHRIRNFLVLGFVLGAGAAAAVLMQRKNGKGNGHGELRTARLNDLTRIAGSWYEIARMPGKTDKQAHGMKVVFSLKGAQNLDISYSWHSGSFDGPLESESHPLRIEDLHHPAKMKKQIVGELEIDYWLLEIGRHDDFLVLGTPSRQHLWILSRTPRLAPARYEAIVARMKQQGFDTERLIQVPQQSVEVPTGLSSQALGF